MKLIKKTVIIFAISLIFTVLSQCFLIHLYSFKWSAILIEIQENENTTSNDLIAISDYSIKVNLFHQKFDKSLAQGISIIKSSYALTLGPNAAPLDSILRIEILGKSLSTENDFSDKFSFGINSAVDTVSRKSLFDELNYPRYDPLEYIYLIPNDRFNETFIGTIIVKLYISDLRVLSDTTNYITIYE